MPASSSQRSDLDTNDASLPPGALLNQTQVKWLRRIVVAMTAVLIGGFFLVVGRVIYLARSSGTQVGAVQPDWLPEIRAVLPAGAVVKSVSMTGSRVAILHASPDRAEEMSILDLTTGQIVSHVTFDPGK
jgi:hypothetical protein